jgi:hypothetical protein
VSIRYLFCINAGRSGSDYLTELLAQATNAVSLHEALPIMNGVPMQRFNEGDETALRALMPVKLTEIRKKSRNGRRVYCETNHSFIKGWGYVVPEVVPQDEIGVIILRRSAEQVVHSHLRVRNVPGTTRWSRTWVLTPGAARDHCPPPDREDPYALCRWYVEEVERRAHAYKAQFPDITYLDCDLSQLNDRHFVREMFDRFGLILSPQLDEAVGRPLNARAEWPPAPLEELLEPPCRPSADSLPATERDRLLAEMVAYLKDRKRAEIREIAPDPAMGGSVYAETTSIVARAERELEEAFEVSLRFTDTEMFLTHELLHSVAPRDLLLASIRRSPPPGLSYGYDFNFVPTTRLVARRLGVRGLFRMGRLMLGGRWGDDYTHRARERDSPHPAGAAGRYTA